MNQHSPTRTFNPRLVAHYEKESWVAYYQKRWLKLMRVFIGLMQSTYGLSAWQALRPAYLLTRAQMAFAPQNNDVTRAQAYMCRFFTIIKQIHHEDFDAAEIARLELEWWVVHRRLVTLNQDQYQDLVDALARSYSAVYGVAPEHLQEAARCRTRAMMYSDQWVDDGLEESSSLLAWEEAELRKAYTALRRVVGPQTDQ
jgi:hypothetical protein